MSIPADHTTRASHSSSVPSVQETSYLSCPEGRIGYDVAGDGPLVVLVPGMGDLRAGRDGQQPGSARGRVRMSASARAVTAAMRACPDGIDWPVTAASDPAGRGRSTRALTGPMHSSAHSSASANTASARQRRQIASAAAIAARTIHVTVRPATTLSTFATKTPGGARTSSIHRSYWWSAGRTDDGVSATTAISPVTRARQARPASAQPGAASLSRPPRPPDRLRVTFVPCRGWLIGLAAIAGGYCP